MLHLVPNVWLEPTTLRLTFPCGWDSPRPQILAVTMEASAGALSFKLLLIILVLKVMLLLEFNGLLLLVQRKIASTSMLQESLGQGQFGEVL